MKRQAESTARRAYRMEVLLESSRKLQGARNADECFRLAAEQVIKLLNRPVVMYRLGIDGRLAKPVVHDVLGRWAAMPVPARSHRPKSPRSPHGLRRTTSVPEPLPTRSPIRNACTCPSIRRTLCSE